MTTKQCTKCKKIKPLNQFHNDPTGKLGRSAACAECRNSSKRKSKALKAVPEPVTAPVKVVDPVVREARRRALMRLIRRHRAEFDTMVRHERARIGEDKTA